MPGSTSQPAEEAAGADGASHVNDQAVTMNQLVPTDIPLGGQHGKASEPTETPNRGANNQPNDEPAKTWVSLFYDNRKASAGMPL